jgi:hypothetical protein
LLHGFLISPPQPPAGVSSATTSELTLILARILFYDICYWFGLRL